MKRDREFFSVVPKRAMSHDKSKREEPDESSAVESFEIPYAGEATIPSSEAPPPAPPGKKIHRRRPLPPVDDATEGRGDHGEKDTREE